MKQTPSVDNSVSQYRELVDEVFELLTMAQRTGDYSSMNDLLRTLILQVSMHATGKLSMYLRASYNRRNKLSNWRVLLLKAIEQSKIRGEAIDYHFSGMIESSYICNKNGV